MLRHAQPSPDQARDRPRSLRLCDAAFRQSCARQHLCRSAGKRPFHSEGDLAVGARRGDPLSLALHPHEPRLLGALCATPFPLDPARSDPARAWPFDSFPPRRSFDRHARGAQPVWAREGILAGVAEVLGQLSLLRRAAGDPHDDRLDSRLPRSAFLAAAQAILSAGQRAASGFRRAPPDACAARLLPGRRAHAPIRSGPCMAGARHRAGACRNNGPERSSVQRPHGHHRLSGRGAGCDALRQELPPVA